VQRHLNVFCSHQAPHIRAGIVYFWKAVLFAKNFNKLPGHMKVSEQKGFISSVDYTSNVPLMERQHGARIREERPGCERKQDRILNSAEIEK